jgi:hypothetical protein
MSGNSPPYLQGDRLDDRIGYDQFLKKAMRVIDAQRKEIAVINSSTERFP